MYGSGEGGSTSKREGKCDLVGVPSGHPKNISKGCPEHRFLYPTHKGNLSYRPSLRHSKSSCRSKGNPHSLLCSRALRNYHSTMRLFHPSIVPGRLTVSKNAEHHHTLAVNIIAASHARDERESLHQTLAVKNNHCITRSRQKRITASHARGGKESLHHTLAVEKNHCITRPRSGR